MLRSAALTNGPRGTPVEGCTVSGLSRVMWVMPLPQQRDATAVMVIDQVLAGAVPAPTGHEGDVVPVMRVRRSRDDPVPAPADAGDTSVDFDHAPHPGDLHDRRVPVGDALHARVDGSHVRTDAD